ncbi:uncharacterized protein LOC131322608 [Rhododendron vialii]|uniref:uncharacterized protein LOC131322608 n=1 Tax=Rhododendron vialii TaxID=182163 RepID=UPI00265DB9C9|nr:uncharacterized protein LOC131322608 [Rhododendron vialii]
MSSWEEEEQTASDGENGATSSSVVAIASDAMMTGGASEGTEVSKGGATSEGTHPHTPTMEDLLKAVEENSANGQDVAAESEAATLGLFTITPVLRTSVVEPRNEDAGIGASQPIPLVDGDFLESTDPRDILDALSVNSRTLKVLGEVGSSYVRAAATLLGVILSQGGSERVRMPKGGPESEEVVVVERVAAVEEAKAFGRETRPTFSPQTYAPQLHLFEPVEITNYALANADYPGDMLLRVEIVTSRRHGPR